MMSNLFESPDPATPGMRKVDAVKDYSSGKEETMIINDVKVENDGQATFRSQCIDNSDPNHPVFRLTKEHNGPLLPTDPAARKDIPIGSGVLDYFPAALAEIAKVSKAGNDQHNPGEPLHWAREKSTDQFDTIVRHLMERGTIDKDGQRHTAKAAWRVLALLQLELEEAGAPMARGAR